MPDAQQQTVEPVQEGSRWRYAKPSSEEVATWFTTVPLDGEMQHGDYIAGVVIIPASEKVRKTRPDLRGTEEIWEQTFTPYVRVDTRVSYFHKLAEARDLISVIEAVPVPRSEAAAFDNRHMPDGFWWHIMGEQSGAQRFLCCTMRVALYREEDWFREVRLPPDAPEGEGVTLPVPAVRSVREGRSTKAVSGVPDVNGLAKAETGAIGRALGVAGILVVGTGIATAEDMEQLREPQEAAPVALPVAGAVEESEEALNERLMVLQARLRAHADAWREFSAWWSERSKASGWRSVNDAPVEARRGVATKMEQMIAELPPLPPEQPPEDSSPAEGEPQGGPSG